MQKLKNWLNAIAGDANVPAPTILVTVNGEGDSSVTARYRVDAKSTVTILIDADGAMTPGGFTGIIVFKDDGPNEIYRKYKNVDEMIGVGNLRKDIVKVLRIK